MIKNEERNAVTSSIYIWASRTRQGEVRVGWIGRGIKVPTIDKYSCMPPDIMWKERGTSRHIESQKIEDRGRELELARDLQPSR